MWMRKSIKLSLAVSLLLGLVSSQKTFSIDLQKVQVESHEESLERNLQSIPVNLAFTQSPYIYTGDFVFGSNKQKAKMRFTTDTDWTMITGAECAKCKTKAYNSTLSTTMKNGTFWKPESVQGDMKYAGKTVKDTMCIQGNDKSCINDFEFFVIQN
jgi:hypothetical protein